MAADPKPGRRTVVGTAEWAALKAGICRGLTCCAGCDVYYRPHTLQLHHVVPRSLGGDDVPANLMPLCGPGGRDCHGQYENRAQRWRQVAAAVRAYIAAYPPMRDYVLAAKGQDFIDRYYPTEDETDAA